MESAFAAQQAKFIESLQAEAYPELRRAGDDMARDHAVDKLADLYEKAQAYTPTACEVIQFDVEVQRWFDLIPVPVVWHFDGQPFNSAGQMRRYVQQNGVLPMYAAPSKLGTVYHKHRAVHDWYGHIVPEVPFGATGELAAYRIHKGMYSQNLWPILFSDVVLNNAYFEMHGKFWDGEKYVLADESEVFNSH